jgi:hypothetical protein
MGDRLPPRGGSLRPPSPRAAEAAKETAPRVGAGAPAARQPAREAPRAAEAQARVAEAPARAAEMVGGEAAATPAASTAPAEPPRKRKRGFSTLR